MTHFDILTLFPGMFSGFLEAGVIGRAVKNGLLSVDVADLREYSTDKHRKADEYPFGGGAGLIMTAQPVFGAMAALGIEGSGAYAQNRSLHASCRRLYMSPRGRLLDERLAAEIACAPNTLILCGRYEGMDQRVLDYFGFEEVSVGDYILTGGELPAMTLIDAATRLIPGVLGSDAAHAEESVYSGLLEYPQFTRPAVYPAPDGHLLAVPEVLTSGNHKEIRLWQFRQALLLTAERRPDLFQAFVEKHLYPDRCDDAEMQLTKDEMKILKEISSFCYKIAD
jgi:tRNA (guanine37-N1)-methyltransferase